MVFVDPLFNLPQVLPALVPRLAAGALVYVEAARAPELPPQWEVWRSGRAGAVTYQLEMDRP